MTAHRRAAPVQIESPLLTVRETMAYLRCGRSWLLAHRAELGAELVAGALKFDRARLDAYRESRRVMPAQPAPVRLMRPTERRAAIQHASPVNPLDGKPWGPIR